MCVALVNKGNVMYNRGDFEKARELYREALQNDSSCVEALYNFGVSACPSVCLSICLYPSVFKRLTLR